VNGRSLRGRAICAVVVSTLGCRGTPAPLPTVARIDTGRVVVPGSSVFYERAGAGPTVVLLHANYVDRRMWDPQFLTLAQHFDVIRYDARGLGRSGPARSAYSAVSDLRRLLSALGIHRASLVGSSMGGSTALEYALASPGQVSRLVLLDPGVNGYAWPPTDLQEPWRVQARAALATGDTVGVATSWLNSDYLVVARTDSGVCAEVHRLLADNVGLWKGLIQDQRDWDSVPDPPALTRLSKITVPTLVIVGSYDSPDLQKIADTLVAKLPHVKRSVIEGADHFPNLERPARVLALLRGFLGQ